MSADRIYIRFKGKTLGPLPDQKVRDLIRRGQITRMHELSSDGLSWQRAEEFGDYFGGAMIVPAGSQGSTELTTSPQGADTNPSTTVSNPGSSKPIPGQVPDDGVQWYAHVGGENQGPIKLQVLVDWIASGNVTRDTMVWRAGFDEWQSASNALPDQFSGGHSGSGAGTGTVTGAHGDGGSPLSGSVNETFTSQRSWVLIVSVLGLVWSGLLVIYFVASMIVGAEARWVAFGGSRAVIWGLAGLIFCGVLIAGEILLLRYAASLKTLETQPHAANLHLSAERLLTFWKYCAIVAIIVLVLLIGLAVLILVLAVAAADAVT